MDRKRYALCGASGRGSYYVQSLCRSYRETAQLIGIFDINPMRADFMRCQAEKELPDGHAPIPVYTDFSLMLKETMPDCVLVITMDSSHAEYIVQSLDAGRDVICEKPMTIDADQTRAVLEAEKRNNRKITQVFNARWHEARGRIKELVSSGAIGRVLSVDYEWLLDRSHGADYFRRWHKWLKNSGGLLITKATHHFDLINWWTGLEPEKVYANGSLDFYGPARTMRAVRCSTCLHSAECDLVMYGYDHAHRQSAGQDEDMEWMRKMYFEPEAFDGYMRDQCVFADSDIWDNMSLAVRYKGGMLMTYSLNAYMPYEGLRVALNGTKGRLEYAEAHSGRESRCKEESFRVLYPGGIEETYSFPKISGGHGGADEKMFDRLFAGVGADQPDLLGRMADSFDAAKSVLLGHAANLSIQSGQPVYVKDLLDLDLYR